MSVLVIWYGLPGSGKSAQLRRLEDAGYPTFDDFMQHPLRLRSGIASSQQSTESSKQSARRYPVPSPTSSSAARRFATR